MRRIQTSAKNKHIEIKQGDISSEITVRGDETVLVDLLVILLDNAVKYSLPKTTVMIDVIKNQKIVDVTITDQGVGIPKEHLSHIFDRFYQADPARSRNGEGGYGLGLAVAKKIVEQHHGDITVTSEVNKGSTFKVSLSTA